MNPFEDMTLLLAPESIMNLKGVPLTDAFANQASPESIFSKITSDLGFVQIVPSLFAILSGLWSSGLLPPVVVVINIILNSTSRFYLKQTQKPHYC